MISAACCALLAGTAAGTSRAYEPSAPRLSVPLSGPHVVRSSGFGLQHHPLLNEVRFHLGLDWLAPASTPVHAAADGTVVSAERKGQYGNQVIVQHGPGWATSYAHLARFHPDLAPGRAVRQGEVLGYVGSTGLSAGSHLHFEVLRDGVQVDPAHLLPINP